MRYFEVHFIAEFEGVLVSHLNYGHAACFGAMVKLLHATFGDVGCPSIVEVTKEQHDAGVRRVGAA